MLVVMTVIGLRGRRHRMRLDGAVGMAMNDRLGGGGFRSRCRLVVMSRRAWGMRVLFGLVHLHACAPRIAIVVARQSAVSGKSGSVRLSLGGHRTNKKKKNK